MPKQKKSVCPVCFSGHLERRAKKVTSAYRGRSITYQQPGEWCSHCEEGILSGDDVLATRAKLLKWRARVDKEEALEIARIRKRLGITQAEASRIAGGGKNAFSRYERGRARPVQAVSVLFKLLDRHPRLVSEAKELAAA